MSRFIDADKLKELFPDDGEGSWTYNVTAKSYIDSQPTADVVEVVRCKDCVYYHPSYCEIWSKYGTVQTREQGFCYMAERKGETNE